MESQESRAAVRRVTWTGAVARSYGEADEIKREIESAIPAHERAEMIWQLTLRMQWGNNAAEYRLDRSVARVERRGR
jgi:hypothetical protein